MSTKTIHLTPSLYHYFCEVSLHEHDVLAKLRKETSRMRESVMQISPEQGQFLALLIELLGAQKTLDIGTFTGYSALAVALALPTHGTVIACDIDAKFTAIARLAWQEANVLNKIDLHLAPAVETLQKLIDAGQSNTFDFAFIDADKENYETYYEKSLALIRKGGLIAIDNVLWNGKVADLSITDSETAAIRQLNEKIFHDPRITLSMIPIGDGLTLARKRG